MSAFDIGPPRDRAELDRFVEVAVESFQFERQQRHGVWIDGYEPGQFRLVRDGGRVVGGLYLIRAGQYYGGQRVPFVGVHAVAIAPEARGTGAGTELIRAAVVELAGEGAPLSVLFPATQPIYRRAGFEHAGDYVRLQVATAALPRGPREPAVERFDPEDAGQRAELAALARGLARRDGGGLDRDELLWRRLLQPIGYTPSLFRVVEDGRLTGFVSLQQVPRPAGAGLHWHGLHVRSPLAATPTAARRLLTLLADHDSMCDVAILEGSLRNPLLALLGELSPTVQAVIRWMVRVVDAPAALALRGYPPGLRGALSLELEEPLLPQRGRYRLEVDGGRGQVARGAAGDAGPRLTIGERGLAALYTGYLTAEELATIGLCAGPPEVLATASAIFAGPAPWLGEIF